MPQLSFRQHCSISEDQLFNRSSGHRLGSKEVAGRCQPLSFTSTLYRVGIPQVLYHPVKATACEAKIAVADDGQHEAVNTERWRIFR